jgi:hypothetical protein
MARPLSASSTWIDPPATISAPDPTDPITVTSTSRNSIVWPERTDEAMTREVAVVIYPFDQPLTLGLRDWAHRF